MSFDYCQYQVILTLGNWSQTNPLEHESDDHADYKVSSLCVLPMGKIWQALQQQIWSTFVTVLWFRKTEIPLRLTDSPFDPLQNGSIALFPLRLYVVKLAQLFETWLNRFCEN